MSGDPLNDTPKIVVIFDLKRECANLSKRLVVKFDQVCEMARKMHSLYKQRNFSIPILFIISVIYVLLVNSFQLFDYMGIFPHWQFGSAWTKLLFCD